MKAQLEQIRRAAKEALASFDSAEQLEKARIQYLGKKGELTAILKQMGKLSAEERPVIGQLANEIRKDIEDTIANKSAEIKKAAQEKRLAEETLDVTMPGTLPQIGYKHPLSIVLDEIKDIFMGMGFDIAEGRHGFIEIQGGRRQAQAEQQQQAGKALVILPARAP